MNGGGQHGAPIHAGVLVPWANTVVEAELHHITGSSVVWHYARLVPASGTTGLDARFLEGLLDAVPAALAQLSALPLRYAYLACTSAAFMYPDITERTRQKARVVLVSAFDAITAALSALAASHIVLLTPYPHQVADAEVQMFCRSGIAVTGCASLGLADGYDTVTPEQVTELISMVGCAAMDEAEVIVLSCTGWPTLDLVAEMRRELGKPVISSNLAIGLHAQRAKEN
jgi:maleate isomerase